MSVCPLHDSFRAKKKMDYIFGMIRITIRITIQMAWNGKYIWHTCMEDPPNNFFN